MLSNLHNNTFQDPDLEASIKASIEAIERNVVADAPMTGSVNAPDVNGSYAPYFQGHHASLEKTMLSIDAKLQCSAIKQAVIESERKTKEEQQKLKNLMYETGKVFDVVVSKVKNFKVPSISKTQIKAVWTMVIGICIYDSLLNFKSFLGSLSMIEAFGLSVLFSSGLLGFTMLFPKLLIWCKTIIQKRMIIIASVISSVLLFTMLAYQRSEYAMQMAKENGVTQADSTILFTVVSTSLFWIAILLKYFYLPTKKELEELHHYNELKAEEKALGDTITNIDNEITQITNDNAKLRVDSAAKLNYGSALEKSVIADASRLYELFKTTSIRYRTDNCIPDSFNDTTYPFTFQTTFINIFNNPNNNNENY
jgi:hypothetical protein